MKFKTEMHAHSSQASGCARVSAEELVNEYIKAGYTTLVLTNHLVQRSLPWDEYIDLHINDFENAKKAAGDKIAVLLGVEIALKEHPNDYLIYGIDENFLRDTPSLLDMSIKQLSEYAHERNCLIFQAHPFRNRMTVTEPSVLDGIEVYNGNIGHDSRNEIAYQWAQKYDLLMIAGTDYHYLTHIAGAGILTDEPILCIDDLVKILKSKNYSLMRDSGAPK